MIYTFYVAVLIPTESFCICVSLGFFSYTAIHYIVLLFQGMANVLGQFLAVFQCSDETDPTSLAKIIQGSAMVRTTLSYLFSLKPESEHNVTNLISVDLCLLTFKDEGMHLIFTRIQTRIQTRDPMIPSPRP